MTVYSWSYCAPKYYFCSSRSKLIGVDLFQYVTFPKNDLSLLKILSPAQKPILAKTFYQKRIKSCHKNCGKNLQKLPQAKIRDLYNKNGIPSFEKHHIPLLRTDPSRLHWSSAYNSSPEKSPSPLTFLP